MLLASCGDVEPNPGPKFPCGICEKAVEWSKTRHAVACDDCDVWFHTDCLHMSEACYNAIANTDASWHCCNCGIPHFTSSLFDTAGSSILADSSVSTNHNSVNESITSDMDPVCTSSPVKSARKNKKNDMRVLSLNFGSLPANKEAFWAMIDGCNPDMILGCETWLKGSVSSSEIFPPGWGNVYRKDRYDGYGGTPVAVKGDLISQEISLNTRVEICAAEITVSHGPPLIVASVYRPPKQGDIANNYMDYLTQALYELSNRYPSNTLWIAGDVNLPDIDWENDCIKGNSYPHNLSNNFLQCTLDIGFEQWFGENLLDVFLTNRPSLAKRCDVNSYLASVIIMPYSRNRRCY